MTITNTITTKKYCKNSGELCEFANLQGFCTLTACCKRVVYNAQAEYKYRTDSPSVEYVTVRHGRWKEDWLVSTSGGGYRVWRCDVCGGTSTWKTNYCPDCGARMDKEVE